MKYFLKLYFRENLKNEKKLYVKKKIKIKAKFQWGTFNCFLLKWNFAGEQFFFFYADVSTATIWWENERPWIEEGVFPWLPSTHMTYDNVDMKMFLHVKIWLIICTLQKNCKTGLGFLTYFEVACGADQLTMASSKLEPKIQRKGRRACEWIKVPNKHLYLPREPIHVLHSRKSVIVIGSAPNG